MNQDFQRTLAPAHSGTRGTGQPTERWIDDELAQSFPASDPPSWTMGSERSARDPSAAIAVNP